MEKNTYKEKIKKGFTDSLAWRFSLAGPMTWILLVVVIIGFGFGIQLVAHDTPAGAIREYFEASFRGDYEVAWSYLMKESPMQELKGNLESFTDTWERGKNHGTEYVGVRIDGVLMNPSKSEAKVLYTLMQYDQRTREKVAGRPESGLYKVKILQDSYVGSMFMRKNAEGDWKLSESEF